MRVLISHKDISEPTRGGVCELYKNLMLGLANLGVDVSYVSTKDSWIDNSKIKRYLLPRGASPLEHSKLVTAIVNNLKPDIVECSNWRYELLDYLQHRTSTEKTKVIVRSDPSVKTLFPERDSSFHEGEKTMMQKADYIIAVSHYAARDIESRYSVKVSKVIYNGVDINKITKAVSHSVSQKHLKQIFWLGRASHMKGFDILEEILACTGDKWNFILNYGESTENEAIFALTKKYPNITLKKDMEKEKQLQLINNSGYFLSTSRHEGFGIAILEALACGTSVFAYDGCEVLGELYPGNNGAFKLFSKADISKDIFDNGEPNRSKDAMSLAGLYTVDSLVRNTFNFYMKIL